MLRELFLYKNLILPIYWYTKDIFTPTKPLLFNKWGPYGYLLTPEEQEVVSHSCQYPPGDTLKHTCEYIYVRVYIYVYRHTYAFNNSSHLLLDVVVECLALICVRKVPGTNTRPQMVYPDWEFRGCPRCFQENAGILPQIKQWSHLSASLPSHDSLSLYHSTLYNVIDSVVKWVIIIII